VDFHRARRFITAAVLLLAPAAASAQVRDGNLIEYGMGGFADGGIGSPMLFPQRGPYPRLLHRIREEIPSTYSSFRAHQLTFRLYPGSTWREPVAWPFSAATPLACSSGSITLTDPAAVAFVLDHSLGGFSWLQTNVRMDARQ
jgi:hypothetical protein